MSIKNIQKFLALKADSLGLKDSILTMEEPVLRSLLVESLEKMARNANAGSRANAASVHYGKTMNEIRDPKMIRDALGHHASNYKAFMDRGDNKNADKHASQFMRVMHMAEQVQPHSEGKLDINLDHMDPKPWERNRYLNLNSGSSKNTKKFATDLKGFKRQVSDYDFLRQAPHSDEVHQPEHENKAYPFEDTKVNGKHIHIDDKANPTAYTAHEFDAHPILQHFKTPTSDHSSDIHNSFLTQYEQFHDSDHLKGWKDKHDKMKSENPEDYAKMGKEKSEAVHKPLPEREQEISEGLIENPVKDQEVKSPDAISDPKVSSTAPEASKLKAAGFSDAQIAKLKSILGE